MKSNLELFMEAQEVHDTWLTKNGGYAKDMTLRDHFAGLAMQGKIANGSISAELISEIAYEMADAMLAAREAK